MEKLIPNTSLCCPLPGQILGNAGVSVKGFGANNYVRQEHAQPNASHLPMVSLREMEDKEHSLYVAYTFADRSTLKFLQNLWKSLFLKKNMGLNWMKIYPIDNHVKIL